MKNLGHNILALFKGMGCVLLVVIVIAIFFTVLIWARAHWPILSLAIAGSALLGLLGALVAAVNGWFK